MIFNIQKFATQDGSGIRTVVFFKGCPLRCLWCSNPESQSFKPELMYEKVKCIHCGECVNSSTNGEVTISDNSVKIDNTKEFNPKRYTGLCPAKALNVVGDDIKTDTVIEEILKDKLFYEKSGGGVTLSGGEPFAQPEYLRTLLLKLHKQNISVFIETCLHVKWENIENSISLCNSSLGSSNNEDDKREKVPALVDCILADLKHIDPHKYKIFTGGDVNISLNNLKKLSEHNINTRIRIPIIPGFNDSYSEMKGILKFVVSLGNIKNVDLIQYHRYGKGKYECLFREYKFDEKISYISQSKLDTFLELCKEMNLEAEVL